MSGRFWRQVDVYGWAIDLLLVISVVGVFVSSAKIIWFHFAFLLLVVMAFRQPRDDLLWRAVPACAAVLVALVMANVDGDVPRDELFELPILGAMIAAVNVTATRRRRTTEELRESHATIDQLHAASRRELDDQLILGQRLQMSNRVSVSVVHDINNALTRMRVAAEALDLHGHDRAHVVETADEIISYVDETASIANELLTAARMTAMLEPELAEPVTVTLHEIEPLLRRLCPPSTTLSLDTAELDERPCALPRFRIEQILANLVANAVDAIGYETGDIEIRAHTTAEDRVQIDIADTGSGISEEALERVFDAYFTTKSEDGGTGLGLFAVRELLRAADGTIDVASEVGVGTTVRVTIPHEAHEAVRAGRQRALHVLVVEDDPAYRDALTDALRSAGHRVTSSSDGVAALRDIEAEPSIDVVVSDISMPNLDGIGLANVLAAKTPTVPVVLMSGAPAVGVADPSGRPIRILRKPVAVADLLTELQLAVDRLAQEPGSNR